MSLFSSISSKFNSPYYYILSAPLKTLIVATLQDSRNQRDGLGRVEYADTEGSHLVNDCGILIVGHVEVVNLTSVRIAETPLITTELGTVLGNALEDVRLVAGTEVYDIVAIGIGDTSVGMLNLVADRVIVERVNLDLHTESVGSEILDELEACGKGVDMERRTHPVDDLHGAVVKLEHGPTRNCVGDSLVELHSTTLASLDEDIAVTKLKLGGTELEEGILKKLQGEVVVIEGVSSLHLCEQTVTHADNLTRLADVHVLTVLIAVGNTVGEDVVLVLSELGLNLIIHIVHPSVHHGLLAVLVYDGNTAGKFLVKHLTRNLVLDTHNGELVTHGSGSSETHVTDLAGKLTLNGCVVNGIALASKETGSGDTRGDTAHELDLVNGACSLGNTVAENTLRINLIQVANDDLTISEVVLVKNEIERLGTDTDVTRLCGNNIAVAVTSLYEGDVPASISQEVPCVLFVTLELAYGELGKECVKGLAILTGKKLNHDIGSLLRLCAENAADVVLFGDSLPAAEGNRLEST